MKLQSKQILGFLRSPDPKCQAILLYGPDQGLAAERALALARQVVDPPDDPFRATLLDYAAILADPARLTDEMGAMSLLGGRRLVRLRGAFDGRQEKTVAERIATLLANGRDGSEALLVIEADDLSARSALRLAIEKAANAMAIPCYQDDPAHIAGLVAETLAKVGKSADRDALSYLGQALVGDRGVQRGEIDKLLTYLGDQRTLTLADAEAAIGDQAQAALDEVALLAGSGPGAPFQRALDRALAEEEPVAALRALLRHFHRLHRLRARIDAGDSASSVVETAQPPIFWKQKDAIVAQLRQWTRPRLDRALATIHAAELAVKRGRPAELTAAQAALSVAQAAQER